MSVMGHELIIGVSSTGLEQKQQNVFGRILLFWSVALQGHHVQWNGGDHDWLIQTPVSTVQWGMLVRLNADTCTPGHTLCIQFSAERAASVVDLERQWWCGRTFAYAVGFELQRWAANSASHPTSNVFTGQMKQTTMSEHWRQWRIPSAPSTAELFAVYKNRWS